MPVSLAASASANNNGAIELITYGVVSSNLVVDYTITNIPQIYRDLYFVGTLRSTATGSSQTLFATPSFVGAGGSPQSATLINANGTTVSFGRYSNQGGQFTGVMAASGATPGTYGTFICNIMNYSSSSTFKTGISSSSVDGGSTGGEVDYRVFSTALTGAITQFNISTNNFAIFFAPGSTFALYGVKGKGQ